MPQSLGSLGTDKTENKILMGSLCFGEGVLCSCVVRRPPLYVLAMKKYLAVLRERESRGSLVSLGIVIIGGKRLGGLAEI